MNISPFDFKATGTRLVDEALAKVREKFREVINAANENVLAGAKHIKGVTVKSTSGTVVPHGLGRVPKGWFQTYMDSSGGLLNPSGDYRKPDAKNLYLITANTHVIDLVVF